MRSDRAHDLYAGVVGAVLVVAGIIGFFYSPTSGSTSRSDAVFGILDVNGWHNIIHILTGVLGLLAFAAGANASRNYALGLGIVYIVVAVWGFIVGTANRSWASSRSTPRTTSSTCDRRGRGGRRAGDARRGSCERPARGRLTHAAVPLGKPGHGRASLRVGAVTFVTHPRAFTRHDRAHAQRSCDFP